MTVDEALQGWFEFGLGSDSKGSAAAGYKPITGTGADALDPNLLEYQIVESAAKRVPTEPLALLWVRLRKQGLPEQSVLHEANRQMLLLRKEIQREIQSRTVSIQLTAIAVSLEK